MKHWNVEPFDERLFDGEAVRGDCDGDLSRPGLCVIIEGGLLAVFAHVSWPGYDCALCKIGMAKGDARAPCRLTAGAAVSVARYCNIVGAIPIAQRQLAFTCVAYTRDSPDGGA